MASRVGGFGVVVTKVHIGNTGVGGSNLKGKEERGKLKQKSHPGLAAGKAPSINLRFFPLFFFRRESMGFAVVWSRQEQHWLSSSFPVTFKFRIMLAPREPPYYAGRERSGRRPYFKFSPPENWKLGKLGMEKEGETGNFASSYFCLP